MKYALISFLLCCVQVAVGQSSKYTNAVDSLVKLGKIADVIPYLEEQLKQSPKNEEILRMLGFYYIEKNELETGAKYYQDALLINPKCGRCYLNLGRIFVMKNDLDQGLTYFNKAVDADPNDALILSNRGRLREMKGDQSAALQDHNKAVQLEPNSLDARLQRAMANFRMENMDAACTDYQMAKTLLTQAGIQDANLLNQINSAILDICDDSRPSYYYQRSAAFYNLKDYQKAVDICAEGLRKFPTSPMILSFQGNAYMALKNYTAALSCYQAFLKNDEAIGKEVRANVRFNRASEAELSVFQKGSVASVHFNMAQCNIYTGKFEDALNAINQALALAPDVKDFEKERYYNTRGHIYLALNKYDLARTDFDKSIQVNKDFVLAYVNRAIAKMSTVEKIKSASFSLQGKLDLQPVKISWLTPKTSALKQSESTMHSALEDCNVAIALDQKSGFAYYIRAQIKQLLADKSFLIDLQMAKKLGMQMEANLMK